MIASFVPGGGLIDLYEAKEGRTMAGEKISTASRIAKATFGAISVGADLATLGSSSVVKGAVKAVTGTNAVKKGVALVEGTKALATLKKMLAGIKTIPITVGNTAIRTLAKMHDVILPVSKTLAWVPLVAFGIRLAPLVMEQAMKHNKAIKYGVKSMNYYGTVKDTKKRLASVKDTRDPIDRATGNAGAKIAIDAVKKPHANNDNGQRWAV